MEEGGFFTICNHTKQNGSSLLRSGERFILSVARLLEQLKWMKIKGNDRNSLVRKRPLEGF